MNMYFITFRSVTYAQRGERILKKRGIRCQISRTPHWMEEQGCGYCLKLGVNRVGEAAALLREEGVPYRRIYLQEGANAPEEVTL